ncbi:PREDICTED: asialoglycoprotein receptor 2-like [Myotis brandtii]|uniref:asialoglycoprotein receptor 2-like n=1 Tax=Myotis brandtii TaxID=109478 RepID=UPI000703DF65|nr:PREDICTED: asialoglycoprotein receptor 2-like [Myotis brandtii]
MVSAPRECPECRDTECHLQRGPSLTKEAQSQLSPKLTTFVQKVRLRWTRHSIPPVFQRFIAQHSSPFHTWIGLAESDGSWKWVDGTDYGNSYRNWAIGEPNNWQGHEEGRNEDCAEVQHDGRWNDDFCLQLQRWACEMTRNITG